MMFFLAETTPATPPASPGLGIFMQVLPFILMGAIIWVLLIRPERKKQKRHREMLSQLAKNDHVVTTGGVFGIVKAVTDDEVTLLVDEKHDVTIRVMRRFVGAKITADSPAGELPQS